MTMATNAVVAWTTEYYGLALDSMRAAGRRVDDEVLAHIAPAQGEHQLLRLHRRRHRGRTRPARPHRLPSAAGPRHPLLTHRPHSHASGCQRGRTWSDTHVVR
ncbi:transposase [Rhodococcus wratislaviensis IFP 2016]|nr:transposase [Rhodococcus wratislaviensis IFP 2016]